MAIKIQIFDGAIPMLDQIAAANYGQALDALDHAGMVIQQSIRGAMLHLHPWKQDFVRVNGQTKRHIRKSGMNVLGLRKDAATGRILDPSNMQNFVNSYVNVKQMYAIIGGMHPTTSPAIRRNGQVVGRNKKVTGISKSTYSILQKLNNGGTYEEQSAMYKSRLVRPKNMDRFAGAVYQGRGFMERGRSMAASQVQSIMTDKLEEMIHRQINRVEVKYREVKTS